MRDIIISEIRRLAESNSGRPPGAKLFSTETGIAEHQWRGKFWARWGDALVEAGYQPNDWNERLDPEVVISAVIAACRHFGRVPTTSEIEIYRRLLPTTPHPNVIRRHFGSRTELIAEIAKRVMTNPVYADIAKMLPAEQSAKVSLPQKTVATPEGTVYLIKSGDYYKVGRSDDIERRVKEIRIALPDKATLVHTIRTDYPAGIETYWHNRFKDKRANGEWFKLTTLDVSAFKKRRFQ